MKRMSSARLNTIELAAGECSPLTPRTPQQKISQLQPFTVREAHVRALQLQFDSWCQQCVDLQVIDPIKHHEALHFARKSVITLLGSVPPKATPSGSQDNPVDTAPSKHTASPLKDVSIPRKSSPSKREVSPVKSNRRSSLGDFITRMRTHKADQERKAKLHENHFLLMPDGAVRLSWDLLLMVLIFYYAFAVPVRVGFDIDPPSVAVENFFTCLFLFDIVLNFNTALMKKGQLVVDKNEIAKDYLKQWFWIDLIASVPFELLYESSGSANKLGRLAKIFRLLRIFKLLRLLKLGRIVARIRQATQINPNVFMLIKTLFIMMITWHWSACGYWYMLLDAGSHSGFSKECEGEYEGYWCPPEFILRSGDFDLQYSYAFFWGISVTTSGGYEIFPMSQAQIGYSSVVIIIGTALYCNILATCTSIVQNLSYSSSKKTAQLACIFAYLRQQPGTKQLQQKIRSYYDFVWTNGMDHEVQQLLQGLPKSLQAEVAQEMHVGLFEQISVFGDLDPMASFFLVKNWVRTYVMFGDDVVEQGVPNENLYLVFRGSLEMHIKVNFRKVSVTTLNRGDYFGEEGLISPLPLAASSSVTAKVTCELLVITRRVMDAMIIQFNLQEQIGNVLRLQARRRRALNRWKVAIAKVVAVNRFKGHDNDESFIQAVKEQQFAVNSVPFRLTHNKVAPIAKPESLSLPALQK